MIRNPRVLAVVIGGLVVVLWFSVVAPLRRDVQELRAGLPDFRTQYSEMVGLYAAYQQLQVEEKALQQWVDARPADFAIFAHVTEVAQQQNLALGSLRPDSRLLTDRWSLERVKVEVEGVPLPRLIAFLHALTVPHSLVRIESFELRGGTAAGGLNVVFEAQTIAPRQ